MTIPRFSGASLPHYVPTQYDGVLTRLAGPTAVNLLTAKDRLKAATDAFVKTRAQGTASQKVMAAGAKALSGIGQKLLDHDWHEFPQVALGKFKFKVSEPPIGALMLLLYPFTMGPRLYRAYERGKKNNDTREVFDVLRRDGTAITIFLFMLKPLLLAMNKIKQRFDGLQLVNDGKVLTYSQFQNYKITNTEVLFRILEEKNAQGLLKAIKTLNDRGLSKQGDQTLQKLVTDLQKMVPEFVEQFNNNQHSRHGLEEMAEQIVKKIQQGDIITARSVKQAGKGLSAKILNRARGLEGGFSDVLVNYAKTRRLPQDVISFAIVIGAIGWFPVWFNSFWNRKQFEAEQSQARATNLANFNPQLTFQSLKQSSQLSGNAFSQSR